MKRKRKCKQCPLFVNDMPWLWCAGPLACGMSANGSAIWSQRFRDGTVGFRPLMREIAIFWMMSSVRYTYIPLIKHFSLLSTHRWREVSPKLGLMIVLPAGRMDWSMWHKHFRERSSIQEFLLEETSLLTVDFCIPKSQKCSVLFTISKTPRWPRWVGSYITMTLPSTDIFSQDNREIAWWAHLSLRRRLPCVSLHTKFLQRRQFARWMFSRAYLSCSELFSL